MQRNIAQALIALSIAASGIASDLIGSTTASAQSLEDLGIVQIYGPEDGAEPATERVYEPADESSNGSIEDALNDETPPEPRTVVRNTETGAITNYQYDGTDPNSGADVLCFGAGCDGGNDFGGATFVRELAPKYQWSFMTGVMNGIEAPAGLPVNEGRALLIEGVEVEISWIFDSKDLPAADANGNGIANDEGILILLPGGTTYEDVRVVDGAGRAVRNDIAYDEACTTGWKMFREGEAFTGMYIHKSFMPDNGVICPNADGVSLLDVLESQKVAIDANHLDPEPNRNGDIEIASPGETDEVVEGECVAYNGEVTGIAERTLVCEGETVNVGYAEAFDGSKSWTGCTITLPVNAWVEDSDNDPTAALAECQ